MKFPEQYRYIVVEGNIGAGKTSLAQKLAADTGGRLLLEEFAENSFLPQFYKDPAKYAFPLELSFLAARHNQLKQQFHSESNVPVISDYHIRKSLLFAQNTLEPEELKLFQAFYDIISSQIPEPDLVIYLEKGIGKLRSNILNRGREYERELSENYLTSLQNSYHSLIKNHNFEKLVIIPSENLDFVNNEMDYQFIISMLKT